MIWLLEEITNNSNKYCIFGLTFQSPLQYLLKLFVISSNNQIMYKLLFILFIIKLYARINISESFMYCTSWVLLNLHELRESYHTIESKRKTDSFDYVSLLQSCHRGI